MHVRKVLLIEGSVNALITVCKMTVGIMTGSAAVVADAVHSLTDLANNLFAWLAIKISESPADSSHPYGHQKFEQLAVFALASLLTIVALPTLSFDTRNWIICIRYWNIQMDNYIVSDWPWQRRREHDADLS